MIRGAFVQVVFDLLPQRSAAQAFLDHFVEIVAVIDADDAQAVDDIFVNAFGKWVPFLKDHADAPAQIDDVDGRVVDIFAVELDLPGDPGVQHQIVHAVQAAQQGGFAAAGGADESRRFFFADLQIDGFERALVAVVEIDVFDAENLVYRLAGFRF